MCHGEGEHHKVTLASGTQVPCANGLLEQGKFVQIDLGKRGGKNILRKMVIRNRD